MSRKKQLWILVGGNGAGKSTFYKTRLQPKGLPFINADIIAKELFPDSPEEHSYDAAILAEEQRNRLLLEGRSFCFETVFSHPSKIDFVAKAKAYGYEINLVFIHLNNPSLNKARVLQRVKEGGHNVPDDKIEGRIPRVLDNVQKAISLCDQVLILDNSSLDNPFKPMAVVTHSQCKIYNPEETWLMEVLSQLP